MEPSVPSKKESLSLVDLINMIGSVASITGISVLVLKESMPDWLTWNRALSIACAISCALGSTAFGIREIYRAITKPDRFSHAVALSVLIPIGALAFTILALIFYAAFGLVFYLAADALRNPGF